MVDALILVKSKADYTAFIADLNAVSTRYKNIFAQQAGARKPKNEAPQYDDML
jgi:hypothetical protein